MMVTTPIIALVNPKLVALAKAHQTRESALLPTPDLGGHAATHQRSPVILTLTIAVSPDTEAVPDA